MIASLFGTLMIASLGAILLWVSANTFRVWGMGRDMLRLMGIGQLLFAINRIGYLLEWWNGHMAVQISGMMGAALVTAALNIIWMYYAARQHKLSHVLEDIKLAA